MYVEIITKSGQDFGGMHAYCGHDEAANTKERVAHVETVNLGTKDPDVAWRVMAATAMDADRLKKEAGVAPQGRKSERGPVLHMILSWEEHEIDGLTHQQQVDAAKEAIAKLGKDTTNSKKIKNGRKQYGDEHQAVIYLHNDKGHPHAHVMLNKVHPGHGRMLPDGNDHLKLQKWAMEYQKKHGNDRLTPQRTLNYEARQRGEWVKYEPKLNRRDFEAKQKVSDLAADKKQQLIKEQTARAAAISKADRAARTQNRQRWQDAEQQNRDRVAALRAFSQESREQIEKQRRRETAKRKQSVRDAYRDRWEERLLTKQAELTAFDHNEQRMIGKLNNAFRSVDWAKLVGVSRHEQAGKASTFGEVFGLFSSSGARLKAIKDKQHEADEQLRKQQKAQEQAVARFETRKAEQAAEQLRQKQRDAERANRDRFFRERAQLAKEREQNQAAIKAKWQQHDRQRSAEWKDLAKKHPAIEPPTVKTVGPKTKPADLLSNKGKGHGGREAAHLVDRENLRIEEVRKMIDQGIKDYDRQNENKRRDDKDGRGSIER